MHSNHGQAPNAHARWKPTHHERYYVILGDGSIQHLPWNDTPFDHSAWQFGNCFKTQRDAEHAREAVRQVLQAFHTEYGR